MPAHRFLFRPVCLFAALVAAYAAFDSAPNPSDAQLRASEASPPARAPWASTTR